MQNITGWLCRWALWLTADEECHWIAGVITEIIEHTAHERSLVVACHINYGESGASVADVNSVAGCDLRTVVQPEERWSRSKASTGQTRGGAPVFGVTTTPEIRAMNRKNNKKKLEHKYITLLRLLSCVSARKFIMWQNKLRTNCHIYLLNLFRRWSEVFIIEYSEMWALTLLYEQGYKTFWSCHTERKQRSQDIYRIQFW